MKGVQQTTLSAMQSIHVIYMLGMEREGVGTYHICPSEEQMCNTFHMATEGGQRTKGRTEDRLHPVFLTPGHCS